MPPSPHPWWRETVTVTRAPLVSQRGTKVRDWANAQSHQIAGCLLVEGSTSTDWQGVRQAQESSAALLLPYGADIQADDRVTLAGRTWSVDGVPAAHESPTGRVSHVRARLREWSG